MASICVLLLLLRLDTHCLFYFIFFFVLLSCSTSILLWCCFFFCCSLQFNSIRLALVFAFVFAKCITSQSGVGSIRRTVYLIFKTGDVAFWCVVCWFFFSSSSFKVSPFLCIFLFTFQTLFTFSDSVCNLDSVRWVTKINAPNWLIHCRGVRMTTVRQFKHTNFGIKIFKMK